MPENGPAVLFNETAESIRRRVMRDMVAGLDPSDPRFPDLIPGGWNSDVVGGMVLEAERQWDSQREFAAATFIGSAFGPFLDERGAEFGVARKAESVAEVVLTIEGDDDTLIDAGTEFGVAQADLTAEDLVFATTQAVVIAGGQVSVRALATDVGARFNVPAGTITVPAGEEALPGVTSVTNVDAAANGADIEEDEAMRPRVLLAATQPRGGGTVADYRFWALERPSITVSVVEPLFAGPGTVRVVIGSSTTGPVGAIAVQQLQGILDPPSAFATTDADITFGAGATTVPVLSAEGLQSDGFVLLPSGETIAYTGLTPTSLIGATARNGLVIPAGTRLAQGGRGMGLAPISALVAVATFALRDVSVALEIEPDPGYSVGVEAGKIDLTTSIDTAVRTAIDSQGPGRGVIGARVMAAALTVTGVHDVTSEPLLNGSTDNIAASPLAAPRTTTITVTAAD